MNCQQIKNLLDDYIDDSLSPVQKTEVQRHLSRCSDCRNDYLEMKKLISAISGLPVEITPEKDLWNKIDREIRQGPLFKLNIQKLKFYLNVAVILVIVSATVALFFHEKGQPVREMARQSTTQVSRAIELIENEFIYTREKVTIALEGSGDEISSSTRETIENNLKVIDEANRNIQEALKENGNDPDLIELYRLTHQDQVLLLEKTMEIVNNKQRRKI